MINANNRTVLEGAPNLQNMCAEWNNMPLQREDCQVAADESVCCHSNLAHAVR